MNNLSPKEGNNHGRITSLIIQASFIKHTVKRPLSCVLEMTPCHLPAPGLRTSSPGDWLQSWPWAVRGPVEDNVRLPLPLRNGPKQYTLGQTAKGTGRGALRHLWGRRGRTFSMTVRRYDVHVLAPQAPCPPCPHPLSSAVVRGALAQRAHCSFVHSLAFACAVSVCPLR